MMTYPDLEAYHLHEQTWSSYENLRASFSWEIPEQFNIAAYTCDRWADGSDRIAIFGEDEEGNQTTYTYDTLYEMSNSLANFFEEKGIAKGDWIGVNTPQRPETVIIHLAAWKVGAATVPLSTLFGPSALKYRLSDIGARLCVVDESNVESLRSITDELPDLETVVTVGGDNRGKEQAFRDIIDRYEPRFETEVTSPEDDALLMYTSGSTGDPKGVRHAHRVLLGHLPPFLTCLCNLQLDSETVIWKPAEWAWSTLLDGVFPTLFFGKPVVAYNGGKFDPETTFELIERYAVTNFSATPTAFRKLQAVNRPAETYDLSSMRTVQCGGEQVEQALVDWVESTFENAVLHEAYGQTEANMLVADCSALGDTRLGTMGRPCPGFEVAIVEPDTADQALPSGTVGEIAVRYTDNPICFKEYWNNPEKTAEKIKNGWLLTEDLGVMDDDGYITFKSRKDNLIISSGYRIGPEEIEETLGTHPAVADSGVIGVPDDERGEVPKAFVELSAGYDASADLETELQQHVKDTLAKYEYPREITIVDTLPKTATGKIDRTALETNESA